MLVQSPLIFMGCPIARPLNCLTKCLSFPSPLRFPVNSPGTVRRTPAPSHDDRPQEGRGVRRPGAAGPADGCAVVDALRTGACAAQGAKGILFQCNTVFLFPQTCVAQWDCYMGVKELLKVSTAHKLPGIPKAPLSRE